MIRKTILSLSLLLCTLTLPAAQEIIIATQNYAPYVCWPNSRNYPGFLPELLKKIYPKPQYNLKIISQGWQWSRSNLQRQRVHAIIGMTKADDPHLIYPRTPAFSTRYALYLPVDSGFRYTRANDLRLLMKKGLLRDDSVTDDLDRFTQEHGKDGTIVFYNNPNDAARMVQDMLDGKIDAFITTTASAEWAFSRRRDFPETQIVRHCTFGEPQTYYIGFSNARKESRALAKRFDDEMKKLVKTRFYFELRKKYGLPLP